MQVYNDGGQPATNNEQTAPDLHGEQRRWARGILRGLNALQIEDSIARAERGKPDAAGRTWRIGAHVGKMCRQLVYWEDKSEDPDYRVHKTAREWFESEAGLTRGQLRTATRIAIEEGLLTVEPGYRSDRRQTNYYRLNMWNLSRTVVAADLQNVERLLEHEGRKYRRDTLNRRRRALEATLKDLHLIETGDSTNPYPEVHGGQIDQGKWLISQPTPVNLPPLQESTAKNTPKDFPPGGADAPHERGSKEKEGGQVPEPSKTTPPPHQPNAGAGLSAKGLLSRLVADLEARGVFLDEEQRGKDGANFKTLINKGVDADELEEVLARIVERRTATPPYPLSPQQALVDIRGGTATKSNSTPPEGIEALRTYYNEKTGKTDLREYADLAERWDFTSDAEPPRRIFNQLGGATPDTWGSAADEERRRNFKRLHNVTSRAVKEDGDRRRRAMGMDPGNPAAPTELASPAPKEAPEGSTTPQPAEGNERPALNWTDGWDNDLIPVGVSEEVRKAAAVLQDTDQDAGKVFRRVLEGRLTQEQAVEAAVWAVCGTFEPAGGTGKIGVVVEDLRYLLAADRKRATA